MPAVVILLPSDRASVSSGLACPTALAVLSTVCGGPWPHQPSLRRSGGDGV